MRSVQLGDPDQTPCEHRYEPVRVYPELHAGLHITPLEVPAQAETIPFGTGLGELWQPQMELPPQIPMQS